MNILQESLHLLKSSPAELKRQKKKKKKKEEKRYFGSWGWKFTNSFQYQFHLIHSIILIH